MSRICLPRRLATALPVSKGRTPLSPGRGAAEAGARFAQRRRFFRELASSVDASVEGLAQGPAIRGRDLRDSRQDDLFFALLEERLVNGPTGDARAARVGPAGAGHGAGGEKGRFVELLESERERLILEHDVYWVAGRSATRSCSAVREQRGGVRAAFGWGPAISTRLETSELDGASGSRRGATVNSA